MRYLAAWVRDGYHHNLFPTHKKDYLKGSAEKGPVYVLDMKTNQVFLCTFGLADVGWFTLHHKNWADYRTAKRFWAAKSKPKRDKLQKLIEEEKLWLRRQKFITRKLKSIRRKIKYLCKTQTAPSTK